MNLGPVTVETVEDVGTSVNNDAMVVSHKPPRLCLTCESEIRLGFTPAAGDAEAEGRS